MTNALREQGRKAKGLNAMPTVAIIDSQSVKAVLKGGGEAVVVHSADIQDLMGACAVMMCLFCRFDSITTILAGPSACGAGINARLCGARPELFAGFTAAAHDEATARSHVDGHFLI